MIMLNPQNVDDLDPVVISKIDYLFERISKQLEEQNTSILMLEQGQNQIEKMVEELKADSANLSTMVHLDNKELTKLISIRDMFLKFTLPLVGVAFAFGMFIDKLGHHLS